MAYNPSTPLNSSEDPSTTEPKLRENFQSLNSFLSKNHVDIETTATPSANQGKHKFLQMPEQTSAPTTSANEIALYSKEANGVAQIFFRKEGDGDEVQLTGSSTISTNGELFISGVNIKWGTKIAGVFGTTITFSSPFTTSIFNISVTSVTAAGFGKPSYAVEETTIGLSGFQVIHTSSPQPKSYFWMAIGV